MTDRALPPGVVPTPVLSRLPNLAGLLAYPRANDGHVRDEYVERALAAMKRDPARCWTVAALARVAGLSRAPFARRFRRATGASPRQWLTVHRLGLALSRLVTTDAALAVIAVEIGYASPFAFSKAFKRLVGMAPALFRVAIVERASRGRPTFRAAA